MMLKDVHTGRFRHGGLPPLTKSGGCSRLREAVFLRHRGELSLKSLNLIFIHIYQVRLGGLATSKYVSCICRAHQQCL